MRRLLLLILTSGLVIGARAQNIPPDGQLVCGDHSQRVPQALTQMETIKPGMSRRDLLRVFTTEGGLSTGLRRTYVSRDCPNLKVDFEFQPVDRPATDTEGRTTLKESGDDVISRISRPYLQPSISD